ncbi:glycerol dehydrogenase [Acidicapsa acidisoli]|uniref:glycerol dehydrogenase n=1 Tax=Acidicapsa acidisoli TaxID=1615681 RepID=UPI0021E02761|nr:glycerol dehydrogenase [Acidicapsa acidisoli]
MLKVFCAPTRYTQGPQATEQLGAEIRNLGLDGPAIIVAGSSAIRLLSATWRRTFLEAGIKHQVLPFAGECTAAEIRRGAESARAAHARVVIGAGGGKVLDTARAIAADLSLPVINCPTIASSDAPCSALSVIYTEAGAVEEYRIYRRNPDLVLVDTSIIAKSPVRPLVAGMGDALATWFEARVCVEGGVKNMRGGASTRSALALAELCYKTLLADGVAAVEALHQQEATDSLERLVEANTLLSGLGFESSGLAAAHAIHNGLTTAPGTHDYMHGEKVAFGLIAQLMLESQPQSVVDEVLAFSSSVGLPITFADIGIREPSRELLETIARRATIPNETIHNEPITMTAELVVEAMRAADSAGSSFWQSISRRNRS